MTEKIQKLIKTLPAMPGVYLMKNDRDKVIYVGKAISLKNRVSQYFRKSGHTDPKVNAMVRNVEYFDYIVTDTEMEALILENNLIKEYDPPYNILLRDDKTYPYIKVTVKETYPRVIKTRKIAKDDSRYFGPYTNVFALNDILDMLQEIYPIRTCKRDIDRSIEKKERPCLNYYIHRCIGPCTGHVSQEEYREMIDEILLFLQGKSDEVMKLVKEKMKKAADELRFEEAARLRDKSKAIEALQETQKIFFVTSTKHQDYISYYEEKDNLMIQLFYIRDGKLLGSDRFYYKNLEQSVEDTLASFIKQFYINANFIPEEVYIEEEFEDRSLLEELLSRKKGKKVSFHVPHRGEKRKLLNLVRKNAEQNYIKENNISDLKKRKEMQLLEELRKLLELQNLPERIEVFDISNIAGVDSVGGQVVYLNGKKAPKEYRRYRIKTVVGPDDYASLKEVMERRIGHGNLPDLFLMDGGRGQVSVIRRTLDDLGVEVPVFGLYKDDRHRTKGICSEKEFFEVDKRSELFRFITGIQDEVHRFAVSYHRSLREKNISKSELDKIEGVGPKKKRILLKEFKSVKEIRMKTEEELSKVKGIDKKTAGNIVNYFQKKGDRA